MLDTTWSLSLTLFVVVFANTLFDTMTVLIAPVSSIDPANMAISGGLMVF